MNRFAKYSWGVLGWAILVVLWGTIVRATGSGAGCGNHWPTCNGSIIPSGSHVQTIIEFSHRVMSGIALISILILLIWGLSIFPKGHHQRIGIFGAALFIILEALLGAGLVLFQLVGTNSSIFRAAAVASHLVNTFLLLGILSLNAYWASGGNRFILSRQKKERNYLLLALVGILFIGISGAITALGDTLFPSSSILETFSEQGAEGFHFLIQLRIYHPIIAVIIGAYTIYLMRHYFYLPGAGVFSRKLAISICVIILVQWLAGMINILLLAPVWMQVVHLFLADLVWICLIIFFGHVLSEPNKVTA